jgi:phosphoglycerate dehydrogenase-like enzyme
MTNPRTIVVTVPEMIDESDLAPLRENSEVDYHELPEISEADLINLCVNYDYLMLNYDVIHRLSSEFYSHENIKSLKAIATDITGMDWASPEAAIDNSVRLLNIPHYSTESVAETVVAEVLLHSRQRHLAYVDQIKGRPIEPRKGFNLIGRTAGIVGLGSIGTRVAELLSALGMEIIAWNRSPLELYRQVSLDQLFGSAKVICICAKTVREGDDQNVGFVNSHLLGLCRDTVIVNLANADLVDNEAMAKQILSGAVAAYTVERATALENSPLGQLDQVHMPPSNSWFSDESLQMLRHIWVRNVIDAMNGSFPNAITG